MSTIIIDIDNVLVYKMEKMNRQQLQHLSILKDFNYIIIQTQKNLLQGHISQTCSVCNGVRTSSKNVFNFNQVCICNIIVYKVRPYTYDLMRAIYSFFEIGGSAHMEKQVLLAIVNHLEYQFQLSKWQVQQTSGGGSNSIKINS